MEQYTYEQLVDRLKHQNFSTPASAQIFLRKLDASIVMAIRVTRRVFGISMGEAKKIINDHPAWKPESIAGAEFHEMAIKVAKDFETDSNHFEKSEKAEKGPTRSM